MSKFFKSFPLLLLTLALGSLPKLALAVELVNPVGVTDPRVLIGRIIQALLSIVGSLALLSFVYGGFLWITSMGEAKRVDRGRDILIWAVLGLVVIAAAYVLVNAVISGLVNGSVAPSTEATAPAPPPAL